MSLSQGSSGMVPFIDFFKSLIRLVRRMSLGPMVEVAFFHL